MQNGDGGAMAMSFSAVGAWLTTLACGSILVWDAATGALLRTIPAVHDGSSVHFSPGRRRISTGGWYVQRDRPSVAVRVWDVDDGENLLDIAAHDLVAFSPDGGSIVGTGEARDVLVFDAGSGSLRLRMVGHEKHICFSIFSAVVTRREQARLGQQRRHLQGVGLVDRSTPPHHHHWNPRPFSGVGRDCVRDEHCVGHHPRLGAGSQALELEVGVVRMILDFV